ncbi:MAG: mechanosensitive ion channel, partial [Desulfovibrio sp.]|nr:mechanosensitive ion channel [Desulfovibrio sp.]
SDTGQVTKMLIDVAKANENVLKYPAPSVIFVNFGASSLDFALRFWVKDFELGASTASQIRLGIEKTFREAHIEIAFPQLDVHVKDLPPRQCATRPVTPAGARRARPRPVRRATGGAPQAAGTKAPAPENEAETPAAAPEGTEDKSQTS